MKSNEHIKDSKNSGYLVITPFFPSYNLYVGSYIFDQVSEIQRQSKFKIHIIKLTSLFSNEKDYEYEGYYVRIFKVIDFPFFIFPGIFNKLNKLRFKRFLKKSFCENIAFLHAHVSYPSSYLSEDLDCKKIIQHHGLDVLQLLNGRFSFLKNIQRKYLIRNTIRYLNKMDLNIGVSRLALDQLKIFKRYVPNQEYVLYNGVDLNKFYPVKLKRNKVWPNKKKSFPFPEYTLGDTSLPKSVQSMMYNSYSKKPSPFIIGCIANFWEIKDHLTLIKSIHLLIQEGHEIYLRLIGSGPTLKKCYNYVVDHQLSEYFLFENEIPHNQLNTFFNSIDLFVLPSYYEAFGCVYLEAWATHTPFIAIEGQGISEVIPDQYKKQFLAKKSDVLDLEEKILYFYNNRSINLRFDHTYDIKNVIENFLKHPIFSDYDE